MVVVVVESESVLIAAAAWFRWTSRFLGGFATIGDEMGRSDVAPSR